MAYTEEEKKGVKSIILLEEFVFDEQGNLINDLKLIGEPLEVTRITSKHQFEFTILAPKKK